MADKISYRYERKFTVEEPFAVQGEMLLRQWMHTDVNSGPDGTYRVRSIYFDDISKSAYHEKEDGAFIKKKYRARIFFPETMKRSSNVRLECKRKTGEKTTKQITEISDQEYDCLISGRMPDDLSDGVLADFFKDSAWRKLYPGIIVDYQRTALHDPVSGLRVTFDRDVRAGWDRDEFFADNILNIPAYPQRKVIMELKYTGAYPDHIRPILQIMNIVPQNVSKYYLCMNNLYRSII